MKILVDADACPVKDIIVSLGKTYDLDVEMFLDDAHVYEDGYSTVHIVDQGVDSVDFYLLNSVIPGDIVITQDYGLAALCLGKEAVVLNQDGRPYTDDNILELLEQRAHHQKLRKHMNAGGHKKRAIEDDQTFKRALKTIIEREMTKKA
ncbi:MAG: DUF188 domain-containing protein [Candidatus Izimaplasma sp.]|nr:DUF188 domain-containing protein [Candidatus Izimaplasma bacterium]